MTTGTSSRSQRLAIAFVALVVATLLFSAAKFLPGPAIAELLTGWLKFPLRVLPQATVRWDGVAMFAATFIGCVACTHFVAAWLVKEIHRKRESTSHDLWRLRSSVALVVLVLMIFVVGIAMAGVVHQVGWLITSPSSMVLPKVQSQQDSDLSTYRPHVISTQKGQSWFVPALMMVQEMPRDLDESQAWNSPANDDDFQKLVLDLLCPSQGNPIWSPDGFGLSHRAGNPELFQSLEPVRLKDVKDQSNTFMAGELNAAFVPWGSLQNCRPIRLGIQQDWSGATRGKIGYGSAHSGGALVLLVDGSVRFVSDTVDPEVLQQLGRLKSTD